MRLFLLLPILLAVMVIVPFTKAKSHEAPTGWSYPVECCSAVDCFPVKSDVIKDVTGGFLVTTNNDTIPSQSYKVKDSPDGLYHLCTQGGKPTGRTLCIFVPPRAY